MASRIRRSTATPAASRSTQPAVAEPEYEQPQFTLNPNAQRQLAELTRKYNLKKLEDRYEEAQAAISNCASEINDRLTDHTQTIQKAKNKRANTQATATQDGDVEGANVSPEDLEAGLEELREKVIRMTQKMDEGMRKLIDGQHSVQAMKEQATAVAQDARNLASTQASTLAARSQPRGRRDADGDETMEDAEEDYQDFTPTDPAGGTQTIPSTSATFLRKLDDERMKYQNYTLTQRYAQNNNYRNFKGLVHAAQYPNEEVALPHEREWFPEDGGRAPAPGVTGRQVDEDDDDDDIQIQRATTSTKCPLTLQEFKQPLTSTKCSHSFESSAILEMISRSQERDGGQPGPRGGWVGGEKAVRCPVASCNVMLKKSDLHKDMVIVHRIKRLQHARRLEEEEAEEAREEGNGNTTVIDDDDDDHAADVDDYVAQPSTKTEQVKNEPRSTAGARRLPGTQQLPASSAVVDLGESTDGEDDE